jgi:hypothetical protein
MAAKADVDEKASERLPAEEENNIAQMMEEGRRKRFYEKSMALMGKFHLDIDIDELRGRNRN